MFWILAIIAPIGYAFQTALMLRFARSHDAVSMTMYRGFSLGISFLPIIFLCVTKQEAYEAFAYWPQIVLAGSIVMLTNVLSYYTLKYLPLGIASAWASSFKVILTTILGMWFFQEYLNIGQILFVGVTILGIIFLSLQKHHAAHLKYKCAQKLIFLVFLQALTLAVGVIIIADVARQANPWMAGYLWEIMIGVAALVVGGVRRTFGGRGVERISWKQFRQVIVYSSPTVIGTGAFFLASTLGPVGILAVFGTLEMVFSAFLAWWLYQEKLNIKQWTAVFIILLGVIGLKLIG